MILTPFSASITSTVFALRASFYRGGGDPELMIDYQDDTLGAKPIVIVGVAFALRQRNVVADIVAPAAVSLAALSYTSCILRLRYPLNRPTGSQ